MKSIVLISALLSWAGPVASQSLPLSFGYHESAAPSRLGTSAANTPGKDQYGDGPWVTRNGQMHLQFTAKDNDGFGNSMNFDYLRLNRRVGAVRTLIAADETNKTITSNWVWWSVNLTTAMFGLAVGDTILFEWEIQFSDFFGSHHNLYYIRTLVGEPLPTLANWRRADFHVHGYMSDDQIHAGAHYQQIAEVAKSTGLDAVGISDHSPNVLPAEWTTIINECNAKSTASFRMIPGLELSLDNDEINQTPDGRLHFLALGLTRLLPAPEECCTDNASNQLWTLRQALDSVAVQGGVAFAAHPTDAIIPDEGTLGVWSQENYDIAATYPLSVFAGLEFFNQRPRMFNLDDNQYVRDEFIYPYAWQPNPNWDNSWQNGMNRYLQLVQHYLNPVRPMALAGSSDCHQTAYESYLQPPDDVGVASNGLGSVHSLVYAPGTLTNAAILNGLKQGAIIMSDGPALAVYVDHDGNGTDDGTVCGLFALTPSGSLKIQANSLNEFGNFTIGRIIRVRTSGVDTTALTVGGLSVNQTLPIYTMASSGSWTALIVELRTANGYRAVASPVYLAPQGTTSVGPASLGLWLSINGSNPAQNNVSISFSLPAEQAVSLSIHGVDGRLVTQLVHQQLPAGLHQSSWNSEQHPAGLYLVSLQTSEGRLTRKFVLLR